MNKDLRSVLDEIISDHSRFAQSLSTEDIDMLVEDLSEEESISIIRQLHAESDGRQKLILQQILENEYQKSAKRSFNGFGLKQLALFSLVLVAIWGYGSIIFQINNQSQQTSQEYSVSDELSWNIYTTYTSIDIAETEVNFRLLNTNPLAQDEVLDLLWVVEGPESFTYQQNKVSLSEATFTKELESGSYTISLRIYVQGNLVVISQELTI